METKIRGLLLSYGCYEDQRNGVDPWVLTDPDQYFTNPWEAISSLATTMYEVYKAGSIPAFKLECCAAWSTLTNGDAFTMLLQAEAGLDPEGRLTRCPVCRNPFEGEEYIYEYMRGWLLEQYHATPGGGSPDFEDHEDVWYRDVQLESIVEPDLGWYVVGGADLVLSLGMPTSEIPDNSVDAYVEDFDHNFRRFDEDLQEAFKAWERK
jgi:hypothetical protein